MLVVEGLSHAYGGLRVLTGLFLRAQTGEVLGVVGRNGCGKTTMLRAIYGSLRADHLELSLGGDRVERAYTSGAIAYLPQEAYLPRRMRVRTAISLSLADRASRDAVRSNRLVEGFSGMRVGRLSGGERRVLEVLLALHSPAKYVLLDEPFTEVEPLHRPEVIEAIRDAARSGDRAVVITDHAYRDVLAASDRVAVLTDGVLRDADSEESLRRWGYTP